VVASLAGCISEPISSDAPAATPTAAARETVRPSGSQTGTPQPSPSSAESSPTAHSLTDWERSTDCERDPDSTYDSVIKV
jgi:hypothetical protein